PEFRLPRRQGRLDGGWDGVEPRHGQAPAARGRGVLSVPSPPARGGTVGRHVSINAIKKLVVTADDFGLSVEVNEAVERAHRDGILTAASLMVAAPDAADAVARARRLPRLRVGLHLALVEAVPVLPAADVPALPGSNGRFHADMAKYGAKILVNAAARRQLAAEISAQFRAFHATGLVLDHVNAHKHFHLH